MYVCMDRLVWVNQWMHGKMSGWIYMNDVVMIVVVVVVWFTIWFTEAVWAVIRVGITTRAYGGWVTEKARGIMWYLSFHR